VPDVRPIPLEAQRMIAGPVVIRCLGLAGTLEHVTGDDGKPEGQYLVSYDPEAFGGRGDATFTRQLERAMTFPDVATAWRFIGTVPKARPRRRDGKANRPLMALTLQILSRATADKTP
jgi:hypothetical protein